VSIAPAGAPLVRVVVVNFNGGELTISCLRSLLATEWPEGRLDVVLVDNASHDGIPERVARELPDVRVIPSATNRGFAGGCNLGMTDLGDVAYVALVNNDATVDPGWLAPLVATLERDPQLGAASPKILFAGRYRELVLEAPTVRAGRGDRRDLGLRVSGARVDGVDAWSRVQLVEGFWGQEPDGPGQWTGARARLRLPEGAQAELELSAGRACTATVACAAETADLAVDQVATYHRVKLGGPAASIVNNVGSVLTDDHHGADRGYLEPDDGRFDEPVDVFAWCGAGVLLRRAYLDDVGLFDERLFLYYEDLELAWRGAKHGWRYRYVPDSVVHHVHAATSVEGSRRKAYFDERNRLLVLTRHAPAGTAWRAVGRFLLVTASYARRDIVSQLLHGRMPRARVVGQRLHAFAGYLRRAPGMLRSRRTR
jgi:GT2 family glycosyltransferase